MKAITVARKPLEGTVASNVLTHGCGGLNIDACRISTDETLSIGSNNRESATVNFGMKDDLEAQGQHEGGRWPANLILNDEAAKALDEQSGVSESASAGVSFKDTPARSWKNASKEGIRRVEHGDKGGASRFFKQVKP